MEPAAGPVAAGGAGARVLVVGATGRLGGELVRQLAAAGHRVVAVTRDRAKASALPARGIEARTADLADASSLPAACRGADVVIAAAHGMLGRGRYRSEVVDDAGHRALIDAARAERVGHVIYTSVLGASPDHPVDFWRTKYAVERYLQASGLAWTILRPAAFMEMHAHELIGRHVLAGRAVPLLGRGTRPMNFVAVRDVARLAVIAVSTPGVRGRVIEIGGPENLTQEEVAGLYGRLSGRTPRVRRVPPAVLRTFAALVAPVHPGIARVIRASLAAAYLDQTFDPGPLLREFPMPLTRLEDVARGWAGTGHLRRA